MPLTPRTEKPGPEVSRQSLVLSWGGPSFFSCSCVGWGVVVVYQPASGKSIWGTGDLTRRHWFLGPAICSRGLFILPGGRAEGALSSDPSCWTQLTSCLQQGEVVGGECGLEVMSIRPWGQVTWVPMQPSSHWVACVMCSARLQQVSPGESLPEASQVAQGTQWMG